MKIKSILFPNCSIFILIALKFLKYEINLFTRLNPTRLLVGVGDNATNERWFSGIQNFHQIIKLKIKQRFISAKLGEFDLVK